MSIQTDKMLSDLIARVAELAERVARLETDMPRREVLHARPQEPRRFNNRAG